MANRKPHDPIEEFARLAHLASREIVPQTDVAAGALRRIRNQEMSIERPLLFIVFGAAMAAVMLAVLSYPILQDIINPVETYMETAAQSLLENEL